MSFVVTEYLCLLKRAVSFLHAQERCCGLQQFPLHVWTVFIAAFHHLKLQQLHAIQSEASILKYIHNGKTDDSKNSQNCQHPARGGSYIQYELRHRTMAIISPSFLTNRSIKGSIAQLIVQSCGEGEETVMSMMRAGFIVVREPIFSLSSVSEGLFLCVLYCLLLISKFRIVFFAANSALPIMPFLVVTQNHSVGEYIIFAHGQRNQWIHWSFFTITDLNHVETFWNQRNTKIALGQSK